MVEMDLSELQRSFVSPYNVVILKEKDGIRYFPIFIGTYEADATQRAIYEEHAARPLTHDLVTNIIDGIGGTLEGVLVDSLDENTFHGKLLIKTGDESHVKIDSRPSDAIVLAVKAKVPIFVSETVLDQADMH